MTPGAVRCSAWFGDLVVLGKPVKAVDGWIRRTWIERHCNTGGIGGVDAGVIVCGAVPMDALAGCHDAPATSKLGPILIFGIPAAENAVEDEISVEAADTPLAQ